MRTCVLLLEWSLLTRLSTSSSHRCATILRGDRHYMPTVEPVCSFAVKATPNASARNFHLQSTKRQRSWRSARSSVQPNRSTSEYERFIAHDHPDWRHRRNASGLRCHSTVGVIQHQQFLLRDAWRSQSRVLQRWTRCVKRPARSKRKCSKS